MNKGYIKAYRKTVKSRVFQNEGLFKVWMWCLFKASHKGQWVSLKTGRGTIEVYLEAGQFIFGRNSAAKELKMKPSTVWKRIKKLKNMGNCDIKSNSQYSLITIINWDSYQGTEKESNSKRNSQGTAKEHIQECKECKEEETPSLSSLKERYPDQDLIDQIFKAIASTRKYNRVAESVLTAFLQKCESYPVEQVEAGIRTYLQKDYAGQGKKEQYLLGIIRNQKAEEPRQESTGSALLDAYYANNQ